MDNAAHSTAPNAPRYQMPHENTRVQTEPKFELFQVIKSTKNKYCRVNANLVNELIVQLLTQTAHLLIMPWKSNDASLSEDILLPLNIESLSCKC